MGRKFWAIEKKQRVSWPSGKRRAPRDHNLGATHRTVMILDCPCWAHIFFIKLMLSTVWNFSVLMKNTGPRAWG